MRDTPKPSCRAIENPPAVLALGASGAGVAGVDGVSVDAFAGSGGAGGVAAADADGEAAVGAPAGGSTTRTGSDSVRSERGITVRALVSIGFVSVALGGVGFGSDAFAPAVLGSAGFAFAGLA